MSPNEKRKLHHGAWLDSVIRPLMMLSTIAATTAMVVGCDGDDDDQQQPTADTGVDSTLPDATGTDTTSETAPVDAPVDSPPVPSTPITSTVTSTRVVTEPLMFAAGEMQISGEPFAEDFLGRNLDGYDRALLPPNRYSPSALGGDEIVDLLGFSTAVESYEYSKYHVNMIALQSYSGPSLAWGPVLNAGKDTTEDELAVRKRLGDRVAQILVASGADLAGFATLPAPTDNPYNVLGFSGLHPIIAPYRSFDSALIPDELVGSCTFVGGYAIFSKAIRIPDYECGYTSLMPVDRLLDPAKSLELVIDPGTIGMATWKEALWGIDFTGRVHDGKGNMVDTVEAVDEPNVGKAGNTVVGKDDTGAATEVGTFIGSVALEGTWGLTYLEEMDNAAQWLLSGLATTDGTTSAGFPTVKSAIEYDYTSPPRWWPGATSVVEGAPTSWPSPKTLAITEGKSHSEDLAALLLGHAMFFGMTDPRNEAIGQSIGLKLSFDGDPFAADNGTPDGEDTAHDRALAIMRVAFIDLDRFHTFPGTKVITDEASPVATTAAHGTIVTTTSLAHVTIALRQTLLSLNAAITQYGGADPSPKLDDKGILNTVAIHPPSGDVTFSARVREVLTQQATFVRDVITTSDGSVANSVTFDDTGKPTRDPSATTIESQTAAIRALLEGFLATGDTTYVDRARLVYKKLDSAFYIPAAKFWRGVSGGEDAISMTPERFAFLQSALREMHKVAKVDGDPLLARSAIEPRIMRVNKLFLDGWDDANGDANIDKGTECLAGRLQMGEQALTGEYGRNDHGDLIGDRDDDCVLNISWSKTASLLASEVRFVVKK